MTVAETVQAASTSHALLLSLIFTVCVARDSEREKEDWELWEINWLYLQCSQRRKEWKIISSGFPAVSFILPCSLFTVGFTQRPLNVITHFIAVNTCITLSKLNIPNCCCNSSFSYEMTTVIKLGLCGMYCTQNLTWNQCNPPSLMESFNYHCISVHQ